MAWQNVYGSWKRDPAVKGDIIMGGGPDFKNFIGNPTGSPSPYGRGVNAEVVGMDEYRLNLSLVAYGVASSTGQYFPGYYQGTTSDIYQWIIKVAISHDTTSNIANANYTNLFQENFKRTYKGQDPLYAYSNWKSFAYENNTTNTIKTTNRDALIRIEIYGDPAVVPLYAYFKLSAAIQEFRPMAIRKLGVFKSLDNSGGFLKIRKNGTWNDIPLMSYDQIGKSGQGSSRIRKGGIFLGQNRIGL